MKAVARQGEAVATLARQVDDAVRECRRLLIERGALAARRRYVGRWALPSGHVLRVRGVREDGHVEVSADARRWAVTLDDFTSLVDAGLLTYRGR